MVGEAQAAVVRYSQRSTAMERIDDQLYAELEAHFNRKQIMELCFTVGLANLVNRFHATFLTDVDEETNNAVGPACPLAMPAELAAAAEAGWARSTGAAATVAIEIAVDTRKTPHAVPRIITTARRS